MEHVGLLRDFLLLTNRPQWSNCLCRTFKLGTQGEPEIAANDMCHVAFLPWVEDGSNWKALLTWLQETAGLNSFNEHIVSCRAMAGCQPWRSLSLGSGSAVAQALLILSGCPPGVGLLQSRSLCAGYVVLVLMLHVILRPLGSFLSSHLSVTLRELCLDGPT